MGVLKEKVKDLLGEWWTGLSLVLGSCLKVSGCESGQWGEVKGWAVPRSRKISLTSGHYGWCQMSIVGGGREF